MAWKYSKYVELNLMYTGYKQCAYARVFLDVWTTIKPNVLVLVLVVGAETKWMLWMMTVASDQTANKWNPIQTNNGSLEKGIKKICVFIGISVDSLLWPPVSFDQRNQIHQNCFVGIFMFCQNTIDWPMVFFFSIWYPLPYIR